MEDEISRNSGLPIWLTRNPDPDIQLIVEERDDVADALLEKYDNDHKGDKHKPGVSRYVVARDANGDILEYGGLTRQSFRETAALELGDREDRASVELDGKYAIPPED